jgi:hypothetical protein
MNRLQRLPLITCDTRGTTIIDRGSFVTVAAYASREVRAPVGSPTGFNDLRRLKKNPSEEGFEGVTTWDARADFRQFAAKQ